MKKYWKLLLLLIALLAIGAAGMRAIAARKAQQVLAAAPKPETVLELSSSDITRAQEIELSQGLPISGTLKAASSALVKARVSGELQGLRVREGDAVKAGQVLARVDAAEYQARVTQAQRSADATKAQIAIAQRAFDNNKALVAQGFISPTALDTSAASLEAAKSTHASSLAGVEVARKSLDDTVLKAPISGIVSQRLAQPGERVGVDARVLEILDVSRLELEALLGSADSVDVRVGQKALLRFEGRSEAVQASVTRINPSAVAGSRSVLVYLTVASTPGLRQGLFAQGSLGTAQVRALSVPQSAVRTDKPMPYVQVVQGGTIAHQSVEVGAQGQANGMSMVAVKNLAPNAQVTLGSAGSIRAGTKVKVVSPISPAASPSSASSAAGQ
jgi:membrane fusion protein, multidrug efflux system